MLGGVEKVFIAKTAKSIKLLTPITFDVSLASSFLMRFDRSNPKKPWQVNAKNRSEACQNLGLPCHHCQAQ